MSFSWNKETSHVPHQESMAHTSAKPGSRAVNRQALSPSDLDRTVLFSLGLSVSIIRLASQNTGNSNKKALGLRIKETTLRNSELMSQEDIARQGSPPLSFNPTSTVCTDCNHLCHKQSVHRPSKLRDPPKRRMLGSLGFLASSTHLH